jgi:hypothetical protein
MSDEAGFQSDRGARALGELIYLSKYARMVSLNLYRPKTRARQGGVFYPLQLASGRDLPAPNG